MPDAMGCLEATTDPLKVSRDMFLGNRVILAQPVDGHRAGVDAVLLAASVMMGEAGLDKILDVGAGPGTVGILVAHRLKNAQVTCVEVEEQLVALARTNCEDNGLMGRVAIVQADVCLPFQSLEELGIQANHFEQVISNPPFYDERKVRVSESRLRRRANSMASEGLEKWVKFMTTVTRADGLLTIVHLAERLDDLLTVLAGRFGALDIFPIFPRNREAAIRVIVRGRKGSRAPLRLHGGLVLHEDDGAFTARACEILQNGAPLEFGGP